MAGGLNLYGFASGDPVNFGDPFGLNPWLKLVRFVPGVAAAGRWWTRNGPRVMDGLRRLAGSPGVREAADDVLGLADEAAARVARASEGAYDIAAAGGRHAGMLANYAGRSVAELGRSLASLQARVGEHLDKIANPARAVEGWSRLDPRAQEGLLRFWEREAATYAQQAEIVKGVLARN